MPAWYVGDRDSEAAMFFMDNLAKRLAHHCMTPAQAAGVDSSLWEIGDIVEDGGGIGTDEKGGLSRPLLVLQ